MVDQKKFILSHAQLCYGSDASARDAFIEEAISSLGPRFIHRFGGDTVLGINDVHEIHRRAALLPGEGLQVFVIEQADIMTSEAYQAFLKILEEPPEGSLFFLSADSPKLPDTILSRVRTFSFWGTSGALPARAQDPDNPSLFFDAEIAKLKKSLEDDIIKNGVVSREPLRRLTKCVELATLIHGSRISPRYLVESYNITS